MPLINGRYGKLAYFRLPSNETIMKKATRMSGEIERTAENYRHKVVKETCFCLTLPAWREHGATVDRMVICLRHPADVVRSLQRRNRITSRIGYQLWRTHLERLLEHTRDIPTRLVRYENILDSQRVCDEIRGALGGAGVACDDDFILRLHANLVRANTQLCNERTDRLPHPVCPALG